MAGFVAADRAILVPCLLIFLKGNKKGIKASPASLFEDFDIAL